MDSKIIDLISPHASVNPKVIYDFHIKYAGNFLVAPFSFFSGRK